MPSLLIVGAGTWGCATALELARRGHHDAITVLDASPFPSPIAAGNDLNKIAEESNDPDEHDADDDYFWHVVTKMAMHVWKHDPLLSRFYHSTGFIDSAVGDAAYARCLEYAESENAPLVPLNSPDDFKSTMPDGVLQGDLPGWRGFWKQNGAGWVFASGALRAMHAEAVKLGVRFITGTSQGRVEELLFTPARDAILGARTADGTTHTADHTILAAGANSDRLLDFQQQLRPTAWTLAHVPLSPAEAQSYRNLPVLYGVDRGFFIEPDADANEIKLCDEHPGYINPVIDVDGTFHSVPFARTQIPAEAESRMRLFLRETMPQLAERPFTFARLCWDVDTPDRMFLIDRHPDVRNLIVAVGGSGNGFMAAPAVGLLAADMLEDASKVDPRVRRMMRWRPETCQERDWWSSQGRFGAEGKVMDLSNVKEWTCIGGDEDKK
jgi:sarcosine oxidase/L-pipecolate oxidase